MLLSDAQHRSRAFFLILVFVAVSLSHWANARVSSTSNNSTNKSVPKTAKDLDCDMRALALKFARQIQPWRDPQDPLFREIHDALELTKKCGRVPPPTTSLSTTATSHQIIEEQALLSSCSKSEAHCIFVTANSSDNGNGSLENPVGCLHEALNISRSARRNSASIDSHKTMIILRQGIHSLNYQPLILSGDIDSHLEILSYPTEEAHISGGVELRREDVIWTPSSQQPGVFVGDLSKVLRDNYDKIPSVPSLFTFGSNHRRYIRARYPNDDPEIHREDRSNVCIQSHVALEWHKPDPGLVPEFDYILLDKNDSTMDGYNLFASGHGGVCAEQWGPEADSYWCSNYSQGGWAEVDRECAMTGRLQIPVGVTWNQTDEHGQHLSRLTEEQAKGGIIYAWHSQTWALHMFQIKNAGYNATIFGNSSARNGINEFEFEKGGGKQGGRNWCRCDQCTYIGYWCGQKQNPPDNTDNRLIGGLWWIEHVLPELDQPGEFWYNHSSRQLYVYPNTTDEGDDGWKDSFRFATLENIIELVNVSDVIVSNVGFRDSAATFMSDWSAPSGGDWALHRGGTIFLENTTDIIIRNSTFRRLDSNAIFLSRRNRNVLIRQNRFEWLAENAIATWGETDKYDATQGDQPWNTMIYDNVMRELGIYEKQSSAYAHSKAALSDVRNNIMFNMPRAAINFNDMTGGGDRIFRNLIFNTCRESGDHGPINSWDRQPYLTKLRDGKTPSFDPLPREINGNYIFANYGASQGVDNDDGSSWFHLRRNVFFFADGFKMDYGGHDSIFEDNAVYAFGGKSCIGIASFKPGHGDIIRNNRCLVGLETIGNDRQGNDFLNQFKVQNTTLHVQSILEKELDNVAMLYGCDSNAIIGNNSYYTPNGNASYQCGDLGQELSLSEVRNKFGLEKGSTTNILPLVDDIVQWAKELLISNNLG